MITAGLVPVGSLQVGDYTLDTYSYDTGIGMETLTMERESFTLLYTVKTTTIQGSKLSHSTYLRIIFPISFIFHRLSFHVHQTRRPKRSHQMQAFYFHPKT